MHHHPLVLVMAVAALALPLDAQSPREPADSESASFGQSSNTAAPAEKRGASGDQQRRYHFAAAGTEISYRLYVPRGYDPEIGAPLVVALHGYGGTQDYFFDIVANLSELCERYGFIFVAPMGFARDGWYGAPLSIPGSAPRSSGAPPPAPTRTADEEARYREWSEADVMNVIDIVRGEYTIDSDRMYLIGHSMGGFGTWWLGQKYADLWAAIAPMSGVLPNVDYQLPKLANVAVHVSIGGAENPHWVAASRRQVRAMKEMGMTVEYFEPADATHGSMVPAAVPQVFEFLARQSKKGRN